MALPATHIRFAAAIADRLQVSEPDAYFSGTLYPDSRWVTGIARNKTHDPRFLNPDFPSDDFTLGWHIHCLCDRIQGDIHDALLDGLATMTADARWVRVSAAKVIQDMKDASAAAPLDDRFSLLRCYRTPNGESDARVAAYFDLVRHAYGKGRPPTRADYAGLWAGVGLDRPLIAEIERQVASMMADDVLVSRLHQTFERMVARWTSTYEPTRQRG
jgi:hypothetical protein